MATTIQPLATILARTMMAAIFLMSAAGNKIPQFSNVADSMAAEGVPAPKLMLGGAIVFLILGSLSLIAGFRARIGATLLFVFLLLATYFFHDFWTFEDAAQRQQQMTQFMKNMALMGAMLFVIATGSGAGSVDSVLAARSPKDND